MTTFEQCRREAYKLLGDAADQIRAGDWPDIDGRQRQAIRAVLRLITLAKEHLNEAAR